MERIVRLNENVQSVKINGRLYINDLLIIFGELLLLVIGCTVAFYYSRKMPTLNCLLQDDIVTKRPL